MEGDFIRNEALNLIRGDLIGEGSTRKVYQHRQNVDWVVKVEEGAKSFANAIEWGTWINSSDFLKRWLCPCVDISPAGGILIMQKADPIRSQELPKRLPAFFNDLKISNWGILKGKPVCLDYAIQNRSFNLQMQKAFFG